jgi:hypothetical protein
MAQISTNYNKNSTFLINFLSIDGKNPSKKNGKDFIDPFKKRREIRMCGFEERWVFDQKSPTDAKKAQILGHEVV